jgi:hypothetical protein
MVALHHKCDLCLHCSQHTSSTVPDFHFVLPVAYEAAQVCTAFEGLLARTVRCCRIH